MFSIYAKFLGVLLCLLTLAGTIFYMNATPKKTLQVLAGAIPSSLDPIEYDYLKNHPLQSVFNITLVSTYRGKGGVVPSLAESWRAEDSSTKWYFRIRSDLVYSDGRNVTVESVERSLKRTIFLLRKAGTKNEFVNNLLGIAQFKSLTSPLPGIFIKGSDLIFSFSKPIPNLAEIISFGVFAITDPLNFDQAGTWIKKDLKEVSGIGPYEIRTASETEITLNLKLNYPADLHHQSSFSEIRFFTDLNSRATSDLYFGSSDSENFSTEDFNFFGRGARNIMYMHVLPWADKKHPLGQESIRCLLRQYFQEEITKQGSEATKSFFPWLCQELVSLSRSNHALNDLRIVL